MSGKRFGTILRWTLIAGLFGYAGYGVVVQTVVFGLAMNTLANKKEVFVDNAAKIYFDPECMREWLRIKRAGARYPIGESTLGEARDQGYTFFRCRNPVYPEDELFSETRRAAVNGTP